MQRLTRCLAALALHRCHHALKRGESSSEGIALFTRDDLFELREVRVVGLDCAADSPPSLAALLEAQPRTTEGLRGLPTVGQLALLRERRSGRSLLVANTHLYFANPAVHVRAMQTAHLLHHASSWARELEGGESEAEGGAVAEGGAAASATSGAATGATALVVAGDLNSDSTDAVLRLLTDGSLSAHDPDWLHGALMWSTSLGLE